MGPVTDAGNGRNRRRKQFPDPESDAFRLQSQHVCQFSSLEKASTSNDSSHPSWFVHMDQGSAGVDAFSRLLGMRVAAAAPILPNMGESGTINPACPSARPGAGGREPGSARLRRRGRADGEIPEGGRDGTDGLRGRLADARRTRRFELPAWPAAYGSGAPLVRHLLSPGRTGAPSTACARRASVPQHRTLHRARTQDFTDFPISSVPRPTARTQSMCAWTGPAHRSSCGLSTTPLAACSPVRQRPMPKFRIC